MSELKELSTKSEGRSWNNFIKGNFFYPVKLRSVTEFYILNNPKGCLIQTYEDNSLAMQQVNGMWWNFINDCFVEDPDWKTQWFTIVGMLSVDEMTMIRNSIEQKTSDPDWMLLHQITDVVIEMVSKKAEERSENE